MAVSAPVSPPRQAVPESTRVIVLEPGRLALRGDKKPPHCKPYLPPCPW